MFLILETFYKSDYKIIIVNIAIVTIIAMILLLLNYLVRQKTNKMVVDVNKLTTYECGFDPFSEMHSHAVDVQFFIVSIMFLIFDIELAMMFPWAIHWTYLGIFSFWVLILFLVLLTIGFAYEWQKGALTWYTAPKPFYSVEQSYKVIESRLAVLPVTYNFITDYVVINGVILLGLIIGLIFYALYENNNKREQTSIGLNVIRYAQYGLVVLIFVSFLLHSNNGQGSWTNYFIANNFTMLIITSALVFAFIIISLSQEFVYTSKFSWREFTIIVLFATLFIVILTSSYNLFSLFLSLEGMSLCLYILAAYKFNVRSSSEASIKYFTMGALSAGCLLFGIACIYGVVQSVSFIDLAMWLEQTSIDLYFVYGVGSLFIIYGLLFKAGAWPLHQWVPDVYEGVPNIVTAFFAVVVKFIIIGLIIRIIPYLHISGELLVIPALLSLIVGVAGALESNKIKRFFAYTAINQVGLLLLGLYVSASMEVLFYLFTYILATIAFFILLLGTSNIRSKSGFSPLVFLSDLNNFAHYNLSKAVLFIIVLFAMAGLPPFITSIGKWFIMEKLADSGYSALFFIVVLISVFSIYYYVRLTKSLFFEPEINRAAKKTVEINGEEQVFIYTINGTVSHNLLLSILVLLSITPVLIFINWPSFTVWFYNIFYNI
jgi:NADH-quinone oxidoreductase subunit N